MTDNVLPLDLARFTRADVAKIQGLGDKLRLMHRWFRYERQSEDGRDALAIYSGDRGPKTYVSYRILRRSGGEYELRDAKGGEALARGRSIDAVIGALPDDFYYTGR